MAHDTGIVGDGITADAALAIPNAEPGATWAFRVDGGAPAAVYDPGALKDGAHTVSVTQTDAAGNVSAAGSLSFLLDSQAPVLQPISRMQVGLVPAEGTVLAGATDATALHVVDARFGSNGAEFAVPAGGQTVVSGSHGTLSIAGDGSYRYVPTAYAADGDTFSIDVADAAGNVSRTSLHIATSSAIPQSAPSFTFALTEARFDFSHGHDLMTAPDGTVTDLTGARTITFTDGTVQEADGSPLVDDLYYVATNPDVWAAHVDPDQHYAQYGWREGRNPNAYFDTRAYLAQNPDVAAAGVNPLTHYDTYGRHEGRSPGSAFSAEAYLAVNPDVAAAGLDPLAHYLQYGRSEGRATVAGLTLTGDGDHLYGDFDASFYLAANPDVAAVARSSGVASDSFAFSHYLRYGAAEGRDPNPYFDTRFYLAHNPDVAASGMNPLLHYEQYGWREGRDPSAAFGTNAYLTAHPNVAAAQMDPLHHYLVNGFQDGRPVA